MTGVYKIEVVGGDPYGRWPRLRTGDLGMALRAALSYVREMEKELGAALPIKVTGPGYDGTPLSAAEVRTAVWVFGTDRDRFGMLQSN